MARFDSLSHLFRDVHISGPIVAAVLSKENAVQAWRDFLGPTDSNKARASAPTSYDLCSCLCLWASIRARFGTDGTRNAAHGSDSLSSAHREARFFFPEGALALFCPVCHVFGTVVNVFIVISVISIISGWWLCHFCNFQTPISFSLSQGAAICEPLASSDVTRDYISKSINPTLLQVRALTTCCVNMRHISCVYWCCCLVTRQGLTALCKARPADPITWLAAWLLANNPNKPVVVEPSD